MQVRVPESVAAQFDAAATERGETRTQALKRLILEATMTTIDTITDWQIRTLSDDAADHGDHEQVEICHRALNGDDAARAECARVIAEAEINAQS